MGSMKDLVNLDLNELSDVVAENPVVEALETEEVVVAAPSKAQEKVRSKKYVAARSRVDRTRAYPLDEALSLLKQASYSRFDGTVSAHINLLREIPPSEVTFPHSVGKQVRVAIVDAEVLEKIAQEVIEFDVLLTTPAMMPKLAKYARFLGPRGLMPNPKNGTVTSDPEAKMASLQAGSVIIKTEKKSPLMHVRVGKISQSETDLAENIQALLKAVNIQNVAKLTLAATMSPGIKVQL